jgi:hypothetical protein
MKTQDPQPATPGSDAAIATGCTCPVLDNGHGAGIGKGRYWISGACPVHGDAAHMRRRQAAEAFAVEQAADLQAESDS